MGTTRAATEQLAWLVDLPRNRFVAPPRWSDIPDSILALSKDVPKGVAPSLWREHVRGLHRARFDLDYEPRCLAVSPSGRRLAVGTKAGQIRVFALREREPGPGQRSSNVDPTRVRWGPESVPQTESKEARDQLFRTGGASGHKPPQRAIRALAFVGEETLVAGWDRGGVFVFQSEAGKKGQGPSWRSSQSSGPDDVENEGSSPGRLTALVPLFPPGSGPELLQCEADLRLLGMTDASRVYLVTWQTTTGTLTVRVREPAQVLAVPARCVPTSGVDPDARGEFADSAHLSADFGRIIGGAWAGGTLWVLSPTDLAGFTPEGDHLVANGPASRVDVPRQLGGLTGLAACPQGLALLAHDGVGLRNLDSGVQGGASSEQWLVVPGAQVVAVASSFLGWKGTPTPLRALVATKDPGLRWHSWCADPQSARFDPGDPHLAGTSQAAVLDMAVVSVRGTSGGGPDTAASHSAYLVVCTRNHKVIISSLAEMSAVKAELKKRLRAQIASESPVEEGTVGALWARLGEERTSAPSLRLPGVASFLLREVVRRTFQSPPDAVPRSWILYDEGADALLRVLNGEDLSRFAQWWGAALGRSAFHGRRRWPEGFGEVPVDLIRLWSLRILRRARECDPNLPRELARRLVDDLSAAIQRDKPLGSEEAASAIGRVVRYLRKWVVLGFTFGEKERGLKKIVDWNLDCGRSVDALAYAARLLRDRVDPEWIRKESGEGRSQMTSDVVTTEDGGVVFQASMNGRIIAVDEDGETLRWTLAPDGPAHRNRMDGLTLSLDIQENEIRRAGWAEYKREYKHLPYVRRLLLLEENPDEEGGWFILLGGYKGWRRTNYERLAWPERRQVMPFLFAILARRNGSVLEIRQVETWPTDGEIYMLSAVTDSRRLTDGRAQLLVGTGGTWHRFDQLPAKGADDAVLGKARRHSPPFASFQVSIGAGKDRGLELEELPGPIQEGPDRSYTPPEAALAPCWAMAVVPGNGHDSAAGVFCGFSDGALVQYQRNGGNWEPVPRSGLPKLPGAIWHLRYLGVPGARLLAYGTAEGHVGLVELVGKDLTHPVHLAHTRLTTPVCGLEFYEDEDRWGDTRQRLLAITESGKVSIFDAEVNDPSRAGRGEVTESGKVSSFDADVISPRRAGRSRDRLPRLPVPGQLLDHFHLGDKLPSARAVALREEKVPLLYVGTENGDLAKLRLRVPRDTLRRGTAWRTSGLKPDVSWRRIIDNNLGRDWALHWLRAFDVGGEQFERSSFWLTFDQLTVPARAEELRAFVGRLQREAHARRPFTRGAAKILWDRAARLANEKANLALSALTAVRRRPAGPRGLETRRATVLERARRRRALRVRASVRLRCYLERLKLVDSLCLQWIGQEASIESRVLIHSFNRLFDWGDLLLLAVASTERQVQRELQAVRRFLLRNVIQVRFNHWDPLVGLEAMRTINDGLFRAVANHLDNRARRSWRVELKPESGSLGFRDLMTSVGDLAERNPASFAPRTPLGSELIRFFALSLLLMQDTPLTVCQVVSESRLLESNEDRVAEAIVAQARRQLEEVIGRAGLPTAIGLDRRIGLFEAYADRRLLDRRPLEEGPRAHWDALMSQPGSIDRRYSHERFVWETQQVLRVAQSLRHLRPGRQSSRGSSGPTAQDPDGPTALDPTHFATKWLLDEGAVPPTKYYRHSRFWLKELRTERRKLITLPPAEAETRCGELLDRLDGTSAPDAENPLYEPQRSHYRSIVTSWVEDLAMERRARPILEVLQRLDRHAIRASNDSLMSTVVEHSMRVAPVGFADFGGPVPSLRTRIAAALRERGVELDQRLFEETTRLVGRTQLREVLLWVARSSLLPTHETSRVGGIREVTLAEMLEELVRVAEVEAVHLEPGGNCLEGELGPRCEGCGRAGSCPQQGRVTLPGTLAVWSALLGEILRNIYKTSVDAGIDQPTGSARLTFERPDEQPIWSLLLTGEVSFYSSLKGRYQVDSREELEALLREFEDGRARDQTGYGLFMLKQLGRFHDDLDVNVALVSSEEPGDTWRDDPLGVQLSWGLSEARSTAQAAPATPIPGGA